MVILEKFNTFANIKKKRVINHKSETHYKLFVSMKTIRTMLYKNYALSKVVDSFNQEFVIIDGDKGHLFASFADAKRAVNGQATWFNIPNY